MALQTSDFITRKPSWTRTAFSHIRGKKGSDSLRQEVRSSTQYVRIFIEMIRQSTLELTSLQLTARIQRDTYRN